MNNSLLDIIEEKTVVLIKQQAQLKSLCTRLQQERDTLLVKNHKATERIECILEQLRLLEAQEKPHRSDREESA